MRKISDKLRQFHKKQQERVRRNQQRKANINRHVKRKKNSYRQKHKDYFYRADFLHSFYQRIYNRPPLTVAIPGDFGIEEDSIIDNFLDKASEIIDFRSNHLTIDLKDCTRMWPSAVTMLCSLMHWVELSTTRSQRRPLISSTTAKSDQVNSYLRYCGFYDYVNRPSDDVKHDYYSDTEIVKIHKETKTSNIETSEIDIINLLTNFSLFNAEQIELFDCKVLTEAFNNVTEHGVSLRDKGWWLLAQYHKTHHAISLCIADNGIGIRNSLMTGPQANDIGKKLENIHENDGKFIKMAMEERVSGAMYAPQKTVGLGIPMVSPKKYESGSHRVCTP